MPKINTDEFNPTALDLINAGMTQKQIWADIGISKSATLCGIMSKSGRCGEPVLLAIMRRWNRPLLCCI